MVTRLPSRVTTARYVMLTAARWRVTPTPASIAAVGGDVLVEDIRHLAADTLSLHCRTLMSRMIVLYVKAKAIL